MRYQPKGYFYFNEELAKIFPPAKDRVITKAAPPKQDTPAVDTAQETPNVGTPAVVDPAVQSLIARYAKNKKG